MLYILTHLPSPTLITCRGGKHRSRVDELPYSFSFWVVIRVYLSLPRLLSENDFIFYKAFHFQSPIKCVSFVSCNVRLKIYEVLFRNLKKGIVFI